MLKTRPKWCKQQQIVSREQTVDPAAPDSNTLVDSAMTVYPIHIDYEDGWWQHTPWSEAYANGEQLWLNSAHTDIKLWAGIQCLTASDSQPLVNVVLPKHFPKALPVRDRQNKCRYVLHISKISRNFLGEWKLGLQLHVQDETALSVHQSGSVISRRRFSKHLACADPGKLRKEMPWLLSTTPGHLTHTSQPNNSLWTFPIQGFERFISLQPAVLWQLWSLRLR